MDVLSKLTLGWLTGHVLGMDPDDEDYDDELPNYRRPEEISSNEIAQGLRSLHLLNGDPYLATQITGIAIVDHFIMELEYSVLQELFETDRTPAATIFLSAQSQMWIFAVYEILRTWKEFAKDIIKWAENGGLPLKIAALERELPYRHYGLERRAAQLREVLNKPELAETLKGDLRRTHFLYANLQHIRISMAKHEVGGKSKLAALAPGYGRIDRWCGSLEYQLEAGQVIFGNISRRNIAEGIRAFNDRSNIPTVEDVADFDQSRKEMLVMPLDFEKGDADF